MYFPYLRGKQFEIKVLEETLTLPNRSLIFPILEPVKYKLRTVEKIIKKHAECNQPLIVISNPTVGDLVGEKPIIIEQLLTQGAANYSNGYLGLIITSNTIPKTIEDFLQRNPSIKKVLIHKSSILNPDVINSYPDVDFQIFLDNRTSTAYRNKFAQYQRIIVKDGFIQRRNADYPLEEFFLDLPNTYKQNGFVGFGDFLIVGNRYSKTGGPAHAVAIHLSSLRNGDIWLNHFVSDRVSLPVDQSGKFYEALTKLVNYYQINQQDFQYSSSCKEFVSLFNRQHFPGLGYVKKLSMKHHIEMIDSIM